MVATNALAYKEFALMTILKRFTAQTHKLMRVLKVKVGNIDVRNKLGRLL